MEVNLKTFEAKIPKGAQNKIVEGFGLIKELKREFSQTLRGTKMYKESY